MGFLIEQYHMKNIAFLL